MKKNSRFALVCGLLCTTAMFSQAAFADMDAATAKQLQDMQNQIRQLQAQLDEVQKKAAAASATAKTASADAEAAKVAALSPAAGQAAAVPAAPASAGGLQNKGIKLTVGGFVEAAGIERSRSESTDMASNWSTGIPFGYLPANHLSEFRGSARQSRLSLLAQGAASPDTAIAAYIESDFLGAATTANSNESNSYNPRLRQAYATIDMNDIGVHVLGGQAWSLVTLEKNGMLARQENVPQTIDAQYVPGFTWTRNTQIRLAKDFDDQKIWAGISLESPQTIINNNAVGTPSGSPTTTLPGTGTFSTNNYSLDVAPDVIAKVALDPGYGHYEAYGIGRFFRDRANKENNIVEGGGIGLGAILPIIDKKLEFQLSGLAGNGIGRYGSAQLPDVTVKPDGTLATVGEVEALAGLTAHPTTAWDMYLYAGIEQAQRTEFGTAFGYGNSHYNNSGCNTEGAAATTCIANTSRVEQLTGGTWWKFYQGSSGMMEAGLQDSLTRRDTFTGVGGAPSVNENITMVSFRYYPF